MNFQKWISSIESSFLKQKFSLILLHLMSIKTKWTKHFQKSIQLWIQYIFLKTQIQYNNLIPAINNNKPTEREAVQIQKKMIVLLSQTQQSVIKGLINVEKLYMIPQVRQRKFFTQKQNIFNFQGRPKSISKTRSSSLTNNRKSSLFKTGIKLSKESSYLKNSAGSTAQSFYKYSGTASTITKIFKTKPKNERYAKMQQMSQQITLPIDTIPNWSKSFVKNQLHEKLIEHLQQNQKIDEKLLIRVGQKIKNIQQNLNEKLNVIMQNLIKCQKSQIINEQKSKQRVIQTKQINNQGKQQSKQMNIEIIQKEFPKQSKRKSNFVNKCFKNEIFTEQPQIQEIYLNQQSIDDIKIIQAAEKSLFEFITQTKKVKLPISQQFTCIFYNCYKNLCKKYNRKQNQQKVGMPKDKEIGQIEEGHCKRQYKQLLIKLRKLLSIDSIKKDLAQKIQIYIEHAIRCGYIIILSQENYEIKGDLTSQINKITQKL